jgi:hypothetical protein
VCIALHWWQKASALCQAGNTVLDTMKAKQACCRTANNVVLPSENMNLSHFCWSTTALAGAHWHLLHPCWLLLQVPADDA